MSLTQAVRDQTSFFWKYMGENRRYHSLYEIAKCIVDRYQNPIPEFQRFGGQSTGILEPTTIGMAMRYALIFALGKYDALDDHPISKQSDISFGKYLESFADDMSAGFVALAFKDAELRGGKVSFPHKIKKYGGTRSIEVAADQAAGYGASLQFIDLLYAAMIKKFSLNETDVWTKCPYCEVYQRVTLVATCACCGGALSSDPVSIIHLIAAQQGAHRRIMTRDLCPTYSSMIGGADACLSWGWTLISPRTVKRMYADDVVKHLMMAIGWYSLYAEEQLPPWKEIAIYYTRQVATVQFEIKPLLEGIDFDPLEFQQRLMESAERKYKRQSFGLNFPEMPRDPYEDPDYGWEGIK